MTTAVRLRSTLRALEATNPPLKRARVDGDVGVACAAAASSAAPAVEATSDGSWPLNSPFEAIVAAIAELKKLKGLHELQLPQQNHPPVLVVREAEPLAGVPPQQRLQRAYASKAVALAKGASLLKARTAAARRTVERNRAFVAETQRLRARCSLRARATDGAPEVFVGSLAPQPRALDAAVAGVPSVLALVASEAGATVVAPPASSLSFAVELAVEAAGSVARRTLGDDGDDDAAGASSCGAALAASQQRNDATLLRAHRARFAAELWTTLAREGRRFNGVRADALVVPIRAGVSLTLRLVHAAAPPDADAAAPDAVTQSLCDRAAGRVWSLFLARCAARDGGDASPERSIVECAAALLRHTLARREAKCALDDLCAAWLRGGATLDGCGPIEAEWRGAAEGAAAAGVAVGASPTAAATLTLRSSGGGNVKSMQLGTLGVDGGVWWWANAARGAPRRRLECGDLAALWHVVARQCAVVVVARAAEVSREWKAARTLCVAPTATLNFVREAGAAAQHVSVRARVLFEGDAMAALPASIVTLRVECRGGGGDAWRAIHFTPRGALPGTL
jgi:hypothetical protein